jgi:hypothetical protein
MASMNYKALSVLVGTSLLLFSPVALAQVDTFHAEQCSTVRARYAIFADGDRLWVIGSKHLLEIVGDDLDKQLEQRGWENTVVYGDFVVCSTTMKDPKQLTIQDNVTLKGYTHLHFHSR